MINQITDCRNESIASTGEAEQNVIEVRRAEAADYEAICEIYAGSQVVWGTLQLPFPSKETWKTRLANSEDNRHSLLAVVDEEVVGMLSLTVNTASPRLAHAGRLGMGVSDQWQGKGVGKALMSTALNLAGRWLNLLRVELQVYVDNDPAVALYRKFEFEVEGTHRFYALRDGEYADAYTMARLHPHPPLFRRVSSEDLWRQWR